MNNLIVDTCVMSSYDSPSRPEYIELYRWLSTEGKITVSPYLLSEYYQTKNRLLAILLESMSRHADRNRIIKIDKNKIDSFTKDRHFKYTCNGKDVNHARLTYLSQEKILVSEDSNLVQDVNRFPKVGKKKPFATKNPNEVLFGNDH